MVTVLGYSMVTTLERGCAMKREELRQLTDEQLEEKLRGLEHDERVKRTALQRLVDDQVKIRSEISHREQKAAESTSPHLAKLKTLYAEAQQAFNAERDFGACDTEPDWYFQRAIRHALDGELLIPEPDGWELYSSVPGYKGAGKRLGAATRRLCKEILKTPAGELKHARRIFDLWR